MKKYYVLLAGALLAATLQMQAQTKIGGSGAPDNSAMLEVTGGTGNNKGILPPRLTTAQRDAITNPATGLFIYNTTVNQLQVNTGTPAAPLWTVPTANNSWILTGNAGINPATQFLGTTDAQPLIFRTNNLEQMRLTSTNRVGIGTGSPAGKLHITGNTAESGLLIDAEAIGGSAIPVWIRTQTTSNNSGVSMRISSNQTGNTGTLDMGILNGAASLQSVNVGNTPGNIALNSNGGSVGIGTTAPAQKLDVAGTARISGSAGTATAVVGRNAAGDVSNLTLGAGLSIAGGILNTTGAAGWALAGNAGTNPATQFVGTTDAQPLIFRTNNTERARISQSGELLVGTPTSLAKGTIVAAANQNALFVQGDALAGASIPMTVQTTAGSNNSSVTLRLNSLQTGAVGNLDMGVLSGQVGSLQMYQQPGNIPGPISLNALSGGNVGISTTTPHSLLDLGVGAGSTTSAVAGKKLAVYNDVGGTDFYGLGVSTGVLQFHAASTAAEEPGMILNSGGNVGIGTVTPAQKLDVAGTARISGSAGTATTVVGRNAAGDISNLTLGAGLSITGGTLNTTGTTGWSLTGNAGTNPATQFVGTTDAQPLILRTNNTEHLRITSTGNIGIDNGAPRAPLSFSSALGPKIRFYDDGTDNETYGFGLGSAALNYHVDRNPNAVHRFMAGGSNGDGTELMRIQGNGNVGISNSTPLAPLSFASITGPKLSLYDLNSATEHYGFGISGGQLNYHVMSGASHVFYNGGKNGDGAALMRIQGDGNVGIGVAAPAAKLDVNGTARISGSAGTPAAIMGRDASGDIGNITLGANLSLAGGVLSASGGGTAGWGLTGNAGTNPATNFIGTTDAQPLWFRTNNSNQMIMTQNGFLGLNTATPSARLTIVNNAVGESDDVTIYRYETGGATRLSFLAAQGTQAAPANLAYNQVLSSTLMYGYAGGQHRLMNAIRSIYKGDGTDVASEFRFLTSGQLAVIIDENQNVGIGAGLVNPGARLEVDGNVLADNFIVASDKRLKENIVDMSQGLKDILKLRPVTYSLKKDATRAEQFGFIAQEVEKVMPQMVVKPKSADKFYSVNYIELIPVLTKAIQEQQAQINALQAENQKLKVSNNVTAELMERVKKMEQLLAIKANESSSTVAVK